MSSRVAPVYAPQATMSPIEKRIMTWGPPPDVSVEVYDPAKSLSLARPHFRHVRDGICVKLSPKAFSEVNARFKSKIGRLTLPRLKSTHRRREPPSLDEEWKHWQSVTLDWALQVCFLPSDPEGWNLDMITKLWTLEHVGRMIVFAVSNAGGDANQLNQRAWHFQKGPIDAEYPISEKKSCPCLFFRVPHGAVEWDELQALSLSEDDTEHPIPPQLRGAMNWNIPGMPSFSKGKNQRPATSLQHLLHLIAIRCHACQCPYVILSDGEISFFAGMKLTAKDGQLAAATFSGELVPEATYPAIYLLLAAISELSPSLADRPMRTFGAHNFYAPDVCSSFQGFRDFDAYQLGRDADYYAAFMSLKFPAAFEAEETLPSEGTVLSLHRTEPIPRKLLPWRCYEGFAPVPLHREIARSVCRTRRPRNPSLHREFLKYNTASLSFQITASLTEGVKRSEGSEDPAMWYQVYVGRLEGVEGFLCLKVFDERLFPVQTRDDDDFDCETGCPDVIRHADSLLRAEEAAYSRLKKYQGRLVPHFYGCVEVELPGSYLALGILTEYVEGISITRLLSAVRSSWTHEERAKFYSHMRRALQVLKAHRISDTDSPEIRFLCVPRLDPDAADRADAVDLVMNNFAFTKQPWAPAHILPRSEDVQGHARMLGLSDEMKAETGWLPEHRERYEF